LDVVLSDLLNINFALKPYMFFFITIMYLRNMRVGIQWLKNMIK